MESVGRDFGAIFCIEIGELEDCCIAGGGEEEFAVRLRFAYINILDLNWENRKPTDRMASAAAAPLGMALSP